MSPSLIGASGVAVLFALLLLRVPVWIALALVGFFGNVLVNGWAAAFALAGTAPFDVASSYTLSVIPLFILMGEVASAITAVGRAVQRRAGHSLGISRRARGRDPRRLRAVRRGLRVVVGELRDHDADGAAGAAQGRL